MKHKLSEEINSLGLTVPPHIAIVMDGNGRWAESRSKPRVWGHFKGAKAVRKTIETCRAIGVRYLTLFAFSDENWARPKYEVDTVMDLLFRYLKKEQDALLENNIRLKAIGEIQRLPEQTLDQLRSTIEYLDRNDGMDLIIALSYGARNEILNAVKKIATEVRAGKCSPGAIDVEMFESHLWTGNLPHPDLFIRTSGEYRLSNFLLWQLAYSELHFTEKCWPDFDEQEILEALRVYNKRERRFGSVPESEPLSNYEFDQLLREEFHQEC